jgi:hypothetical protein
MAQLKAMRRERNLKLVLAFLRKLPDLHLELVDDVERELSQEGRSGSQPSE